MTAFFEYILASNNYTFSEVILTMHKATETTDLCVIVMSNKSLSNQLSEYRYVVQVG